MVVKYTRAIRNLLFIVSNHECLAREIESSTEEQFVLNLYNTEKVIYKVIFLFFTINILWRIKPHLFRLNSYHGNIWKQKSFLYLKFECVETLNDNIFWIIFVILKHINASIDNMK